MKNDIADYIAICMECQKVKVEHRNSVGLLQPLPIPEWKWEVVTIDFITKFPRTVRQHDLVMVVVDKFTEVALFIKKQYSIDIYEINCKIAWDTKSNCL